MSGPSTAQVIKALLKDTDLENVDRNEAIRKVSVLSAVDDIVLKNVFGWTTNDVHQGSVLEANLDFSKTTLDKLSSWDVQKMFLSIAHNMFQRIQKDRVVEEKSKNPFVHWTRDVNDVTSTLPRKFHRNDDPKRTSEYPSGKTKNKDIAYIIEGYGDDGGTFSTVHPFVAYNSKTCIIKIMEKSNKPDVTGLDLSAVYVNTKDVFELVTQVYLHQQVRKHQGAEWAKRLSIPKILYVQRVSESKTLHVCMERINGVLINETIHPWTALAYIMKALFFLQDKYHFMHRDFHASNVAYNHDTRRTEIIDFGMACVNPEDNGVAWQSNNEWYPPVSNSNAAKCTNRSYDVCVLLSSLSGHQAGVEYSRFIKNIKTEIRAKMTRVVKEKLEKMDENDRPDFTFTSMDNFGSPEWRVGDKSDIFHFMYELNEFPCEDFYPERVLERLLKHVPRDEFPKLRKGWTRKFDKMAKNMDRSKPTTKQELRTWIEEYCRGEKSHGEPNTWDVTLVTDMSKLFKDMHNFNAPIDQWDTSSVTTMRYMFWKATAFNQPLAFDTSQVTDMFGMFQNAIAFNQPLAFVDTSQVTDMRYMFALTRAFNQPLAFDTKQVTNMSYMFQGATSFNQPLTFNTSQVTTMRFMFRDAIAFNQPLTFDTAQVTNMDSMLQNATSFNQPLTFTDTSQVTNMRYMFAQAEAFNQPLTFNTSQVTDMASMFYHAMSFNQALAFNTSQVTDMYGMFFRATAFNQPLTSFNTSQVTKMINMFASASSFNQPLTFDTSQVTEMNSMFADARAFNQPLTFNTSKVTTMAGMFSGATAFNQPLTFTDTSQVTTMVGMFIGADAMTYRRPRVGEALNIQLVKMNHIIATGSGGIFVTDDFRKLPKTCLVKPDPDDTEEVISKSHVELLTQGDIITMETSTLGPARCLPCKHVIGTPELHSWLNQNDADIEQNMDPDAGGLLGLAPRFKNECPTCRATIEQVEILSTAQAKNWDKYEGMALKEEEKLKVELRDFKKRAEYKQYVSNVSTAKTALKYVQEKLEEEKKILQKEERKGAEMRATSDKIQKGYRVQRLFKSNRSFHKF